MCIGSGTALIAIGFIKTNQNTFLRAENLKGKLFLDRAMTAFTLVIRNIAFSVYAIVC